MPSRARSRYAGTSTGRYGASIDVTANLSHASAAKTWRYGIGARLGFAAIVVLILGLAAFFFAAPFVLGPNAAGLIVFFFVLGVPMAALGLFMAVGFIAVVRALISLDGSTLDAELIAPPKRPFVPSFRSLHLPVNQIRSVEKREEIVRKYGFTTVRNSLSLVTTNGERIGLFSNNVGSIGQMPLDEIAGAIASAAGIPVTDRGSVLTTTAGLYGEAEATWNEPPLDPAAATKARRTAARTMQILVSVVLLLSLLRTCSH